MTDDLKPCPFCTDGKSVSTYFDHEQGDKWGYAACDACGSRGPEVRTNYDRANDAPWRAEAIAAWNTRTPVPCIDTFDLENRND
jgi:Lar family restriction alleviation protein